MLIDTFLKEFHFNEIHQITINGKPDEIYPFVRNLNFCKSRIIKFLFRLRGLPVDMCNIGGFIDNGFILLKDMEPEELVIGFAAHAGDIKPVPPDDFRSFSEPEHIKSAWNFHLTDIGDNQTRIKTETRIYCVDRKAKRLFSVYWFFISPFSGLIRRIMLKLIKKEFGNSLAENIN